MSTPEEHSSRGCSSWYGLPCAGKWNAEAEFPDSAGYAAAEGTVFHEMVADCLIFGFEPEHFIGAGLNQDGFWVEWDDEMAASARDGLAFVRSLASQPGWMLFVETRVDISLWAGEGQFSTADVILVNVESREVIVFDWKYGKEPVWAEENPQVQGYCLGAWQTIFGSLFKWEPAGIKVTVIIEQPRVPGAGGSWETTMVRVLEFGEYVKRQLTLSTMPDAPRVPGKKQCRWCRARHTCGARAEWLAETVGLEFDEMDEAFIMDADAALPENVTPERRSYILQIAPQIKAWLEDLHKSAYKDAEKGLPTPGMKLVDGRRPKRVWAKNQKHKAERKLVDKIGEQKAYTAPELLSPAAAEALIGKRHFSDAFGQFVEQGEGHPILVPTTDTRPKKKALVDEFDDLL